MNRIEIIAKQLKRASKAYYSTGRILMSDEEFDALKEELRSLDTKHPFLAEVGAPIKTGAWPKRKHKSFMGSQEKITTEEEWHHWLKRLQSRRVGVSHKLDGCTLVLTYENGILKHATSRGDGTEGEDIMPNAIKMHNVKERLPEQFSGDFRGEIVLPLAAFDKYFRPLGYKNARNSANGKARDVKDTEKLVQHLKVIYFDVIPTNPNFFHDHMNGTEEDKQALVESYGLEYVHSVYMDTDDTYKYFEEFDRAPLPYLIDGLICKVDDLHEQEVLGIVSGRPKGQVAWKFESEKKETVVSDITWQIGLSGRITPVAELEPVDVAGVTIKRVTLNNLDYIEALDVAIGDRVVIARAGDVIPALIKVVDRSNRNFLKGINRPAQCPSCGGTLERDGAYIICPFIECAGAVFGDMAVWIRTQNILGFGPSTISNLIDLGISAPDKLYAATVDKLAEACGSEKTAAKLKARIEKTVEMPLHKFLTGLNIPHLGRTNGKRLAKAFGTLDAVLAAPADEFANIEGIKTTSKKIVAGLAAKHKLIDSLLEHVEIVDVAGPLAGKSFAMTGLRSHNGHDIAELISSNGGDAKSGVSKGLDYLIIKDPSSTSNKAQKARKYGTELISPDEFLEMVGV